MIVKRTYGSTLGPLDLEPGLASQSGTPCAATPVRISVYSASCRACSSAALSAAASAAARSAAAASRAAFFSAASARRRSSSTSAAATAAAAAPAAYLDDAGMALLLQQFEDLCLRMLQEIGAPHH